ncbi:hypothetical protein NDU88_004108 [Pleurodeles waltl]|uniref:Uncharacterized protein n=1 Tax=Pleurodeles waltl TaxID=8319 RepID=A0AAV7QEZ5_PLEWA|nr:hypothetical protein NDU88_004108 [Pleurodeles waltl]
MESGGSKNNANVNEEIGGNESNAEVNEEIGRNEFSAEENKEGEGDISEVLDGERVRKPSGWLKDFEGDVLCLHSNAFHRCLRAVERSEERTGKQLEKPLFP